MSQVTFEPGVEAALVEWQGYTNSPELRHLLPPVLKERPGNPFGLERLEVKRNSVGQIPSTLIIVGEFSRSHAVHEMASPATFRLVAGGFVLALGAVFVASVIVATAYSIAILITHHLAQIELALLAAEGGGAAAVHPVPEPSPEPNPDEDDCDCSRNPDLPQCKCTFTQVGIRGGNNRHNQCVNTMPTRYPNQDTDICTPQGVCTSFDASLPDGATYCEVKVYDFDRNQFVVEDLGQLEKDQMQSVKHQIVAAQCGINYCYVVADPRHAPIVRGWGTTADVRVRPECLSFTP